MSVPLPSELVEEFAKIGSDCLRKADDFPGSRKSLTDLAGAYAFCAERLQASLDAMQERGESTKAPEEAK